MRLINFTRVRAAALLALACVLTSPLAPASTASAQSGVPAASTRVFGIVFDSLAMRPLAGALVQFVVADNPAQARTATTDARGSYAFDDVGRGAYLIGFLHPRLDSLALSPPLMRVDVRAAGEMQASLGVPSSATLVTRLCGEYATRDAVGLFQGRVRQADGRLVTQPAKVRVQWGELVLGSRGIERRTPSVLATTGVDGAFAVCGVPSGSMVMTRAWLGADSSGYVELELPASGYLNRDLIIATVNRVSPNDSFPMMQVSQGSGAVRGTVRNLRGVPVVGARVGVWSSGVEVATNANGQFAMQSLPSGTYTLEARAIGFQLQRQPVDIPLSGDAAVDVTLEPLAALDTVRVKASRTYTNAALAEFDTRRKSGFGFFLDDAAIEKRQASTMTDLFRAAPGITIIPGQSQGARIVMRGVGAQAYCVPAVFLNGNRIMNEGGNLDQLADPREVRGVEVYTRRASTPIQFQTIGSCGAIVLWVGIPK